MNFIHHFSIRTKLFLIIVTAGLPLVLAIGVLLNSQYQHHYHDAEHAIQVASDAVAQKHSAQVEGIRTQLVTLSQLADCRDKAACARLLRNIVDKNPSSHSIGIADPSGNIIASSAALGSSIADSKYFTEALRSKRFSAGEYSDGRGLSKPSMHFALPVTDASNQVTAVIFAVLDLETFATIFQSQVLPPNSVLNVTDGRGTLVYRYPAHPVIKPGLQDRPDLRAHMTGKDSKGIFSEIGRDQVKRVLGYVRLQLNEGDAPYLYLRVSIPQSEIESNLHRNLLFAGGLFTLMALITLLCCTVMAKRFLVAPIQRLVEVAWAVKNGDLSVRTGFVHADNEIGMLAASFDAMAESMEVRQLHLRASEQKFSSVFRLSPVTMALVSYPEGVFIEVNRSFSKTFGYSREEAIGKTSLDLGFWTHDEDRRHYFETLEVDEYVDRFETAMTVRGGTAVTVEISGSKVDIGGGTYVLSTIVDVSERKNAEKALKESERRFKEFFEQSGDAFLIIDGNKFVDCNKATVKMLGYQSKDEVLQRTPAQLSPERQPSGELSTVKSAESIALAFSTGSHRFEWSHLKADGTEFPVEVVLTSMFLSEKMVLHAIWRDITKRKHLELREQTRLKILEEMAGGALLQDLLDAIVRFAENNSPGSICSILLANEEGTQLLKSSAPSVPDFYNDAVDALEIKEDLATSHTASLLLRRVVVEDLQECPDSKRFQAARQAGLRAIWSEPILSHSGELLGVFAIYHREPRSPGEDEVALIESAAHLASIAIGRSRDNEHRNQLEEHLRQMQKFEAIGQLAGGIAHDFNNLLTPILVYAEMIRGAVTENRAVVKKIDGILAAANKSKDLTQRLLSFGRKQVLDMNGIDLNEVILSFKDILGRTVRQNISFEMQLAPDGANILADRGQMEQILLNLAVNAQDAIKGNGKITVETGHVKFDDEYVRLNPGAKVGAYILLAFADDGCGMTEEVLQHVFEPFFTTKAVGHGTGLGLATVYGIVKQHDGYIKIRSRAGGGTTFTIYFPEHFGVTKSSVEQKAAEPKEGYKDKTILIVDDNEMILALAGELLVQYGYNTLVAGTPSQALELAVSHAGGIDLVVTDVVMPEMTGPQLYERLAEKMGELPVLYMSGYKNDVVLRSGTLEEEVNFLPKPFTAEQLVNKIELALFAKLS
jgi:PAS domain S-box-containing protein